MMLDHVRKNTRAVAGRFARAERGNVAMVFAIILPVIIVSVGAAIDYGRAAKVRAAMQSAVDATALMISREASGLTPAQITTKAQSYFNSLFAYPEVSGVTFSAVYTANSGTGASIKVDATGTMQADILKVPVPITVSATTKWGNLRYRVALALDNTGSMASASKMVELKSAAGKLIDEFYGMAKGNDDVYMSIIPFARDVNVGTANTNANWVRWTEWEETNGNCTPNGAPAQSNRSGCLAAGRTWHTDNHNQWTGCVMDRDQSYDTTGTAVANSPTIAMAPAERYGDCPVTMLGMTSVKASKQALLDKIDDMQPKGSTNQGIGAFWAWQTLLLTGPFAAPAKDSNYLYLDVVILLTDGLNTQSRYYGNGSSHSADVDARQALLCANMKTDGVKVFAIQVATDGEAVSNVTRNCASEPNNPNYFSYITQASQITTKFQNIFKELSRLRVSA